MTIKIPLSMDSFEQTSKIITDFVINTITGHESAFYKTFHNDSRIDFYDPLIADYLIKTATATYLNSVYKSLILRNDKYITNIFDKIKSYTNHSEVCMLNLISRHLILLHNAVPRRRLTLSMQTLDYENYMRIFQGFFNDIRPLIEKTVIESLSHECTGVSIENCDPNIDLFTLNTSTNK